MGIQLLPGARRQALGCLRASSPRRAGTSRPTLSAYEHGRVSPTVETLERILKAAGHELVAKPLIEWHTVTSGSRRLASIPDACR